MNWKTFVVAIAALTLLAPARVLAQDSSSPAAPDTAASKHFGRAIFEVTAVNAVVWSFNRYLRDNGQNPGFRIGLNSWGENLNNGFEWDDNNFKTNQFAHPYHGSLYFNAARSNGYNYWESMAFSFAGSTMWEYFGETHHASFNDWISTSVGGAALGEILHRFSEKVIDQNATGSKRVWSEIGGTLLNPVGGFNRLITGEMSRVGPNPSTRDAQGFRYGLQAGVRITGEETLSNNDTTRAFLRLRGVMGDPTGSVVRTPYDAFSIDAQVNFDDASKLGRVQVQGLLRSWEIGRSGGTTTYFGFDHGYDYINTAAYELGAHSVGGTLLGRLKSEAWTMNSGFTLNWIMLGGTSSDYSSYTGRNYDYGPGASSRFFLALRHKKGPALALESQLWYIRVMNGTPANHVVTENRFMATVPVYGNFNLGSEYSVYNAERHYQNYPDVSKRDPQLTVYLSLTN